MILGEIFERNAACYPHRPALIFGDSILTHAGLLERIRALGRTLAGPLALERQSRIAILAQNCIEYVEIYGAAALCGYTAVGLNYRLAEPEQAHILSDCMPQAFIFEAQYADRVSALRPSLPADCRLVCIGPAPEWAQRYEELVSGTPPHLRMPRARDDDTLFIIYTSGTTARPKGVMQGNAAQLEQARIQASAHLPQPTDRMLIVMPFYHIGGPTEMLTFLVAGATIVLHRSFDAEAILESIERDRVTAAHLAPTMIQMMIEVQERTPYDVSSLHTVCYASAPMSVALSRRAHTVFGQIFMQVYGMTEQGPGTVLLKHEHHPDGPPEAMRRLASAGHPFLGSSVRVVRGDGADVAVGEVGEIWMRSAGLMQGYWRNPEATAAAIGDGWMHSGDMGYFDDEHYLFIVDRKKDMIVSGGENVYSREVEEALLLHPAVLEAAVIGVPDPKWGEAVHACVAVKDGCSTNEAELVGHCRTLIASYKKPRSIEFMHRLPRIASTNKIDKRALREPHWAGHERRVS
jgi:acyl-CoA synthetase (AMP-forming)/AMP-acid ligase II